MVAHSGRRSSYGPLQQTSGLEGMDLRLLRDLAAIARRLSLSSRVTGNWGRSLVTGKRQTSLTLLFKMGEKEATGLTSIPGKVMGQILWETLPRHMKGKKVSGTAYMALPRANHACAAVWQGQDRLEPCTSNHSPVTMLKMAV